MNFGTTNAHSKTNNLSPITLKKRSPVYKGECASARSFDIGSPFAQSFDALIPPSAPLVSANKRNLLTSSFVDKTLSNDSGISVINSCDINYRKSFSTNVSCEEIRSEIMDACKRQNILDLESINLSNFEGRFFSSLKYTMAQFAIEIYESAENESFLTQSSPLIIVEIRKLCGDSHAFNEFIKCLINEMIENNLVVFTEINNGKKSMELCSEMPTFELPMLDFGDLIDESDDSENDDVYLTEIIDSIENGYAHEIEYSSALLVKESLKPYFINAVTKNNNLQKLIDIVCKSKDVLLVRSVLVTLLNGLTSNVVSDFGMTRAELITHLAAIKQQWSTSQVIFEGFEETIAKSDEIIYQANRALSVLS